MSGETAVPDPGAPAVRAVADALADLSLDIEKLGTMLCANTDLVARHMTELQAIDLIAQTQRALAAVLRADCPRRALADIGLDALRARLRDQIDVPAHSLPN